MKRSRYFLACAVSVFASTSVILGQDAVSFVLNLPPVAPTLPGGAAAAFGARSSSGIFEGIATLRTSDPLLTTNPGWSAGTTDQTVPFRTGSPWFGAIDNMPSGRLILPDVVAAPADRFLTLRPWESGGATDFSQATSPAGPLFMIFDQTSSGVTFQAQPWLGGSAGGGLSIQEERARRGGVSFPPIPPLPANRESGLVVVPEPSTWVLMGVGAMTLLSVRRRSQCGKSR